MYNVLKRFYMRHGTVCHCHLSTCPLTQASPFQLESKLNELHVAQYIHSQFGLPHGEPSDAVLYAVKYEKVMLVCLRVRVCYLTSRLTPCLLFLLLWATSAREIHTWRTLSVGYCMFNFSHSTHLEPIRTQFSFIWSHLCHVVCFSFFISNLF